MSETKIEWTDIADNIIVVEGGGWWCRRISPGCDHCYAETLNQNTFFGGNKLPYRGGPPTLKLRQDIIDGWARQRKPKRHFVASMTDIFGEWVESEMIFSYLDGMHAAPLQIFQCLTKRPAVALREIQDWLSARGLEQLPPNIWLGVTVEDQQRADERIRLLLHIPACIRFLSCEPLLGPIDLSQSGFEISMNGFDEPVTTNIHWLIVGGESGPNSRECNLDWIHSLTEQCSAAGVPVFVKQLGSKPVYSDAVTKQIIPFTISDKKGAFIGDFPCHFQREWPV